MGAALRSEDAIKLFVEHKTHARHLESYLLSFTQVFLLITGALWGYALARNSGGRSQDLTLVILVFASHLCYSVLGGLFSVRLSTNFRTHYEAAGSALRGGGLGSYVVLVYPESPEGKIETNSLKKLALLPLTAKAFFLLLYIGAACVDSYYLARIHWGATSLKSILSPIILAAMFAICAAFVFYLCSRHVEPPVGDTATNAGANPPS